MFIATEPTHGSRSFRSEMEKHMQQMRLRSYGARDQEGSSNCRHLAPNGRRAVRLCWTSKLKKAKSKNDRLN
jgi:3-methyladenine DNA glycosylase AlkC